MNADQSQSVVGACHPIPIIAVDAVCTSASRWAKSI